MCCLMRLTVWKAVAFKLSLKIYSAKQDENMADTFFFSRDKVLTFTDMIDYESKFRVLEK